MKNKRIIIVCMALCTLLTVGCTKKEKAKPKLQNTPMSDIEKEMKQGKGGIQQNYSIENIRIENGMLVGDVTNKGNEKKNIVIEIVLMNKDNGKQYGIENVEVNDLNPNEPKIFSKEISVEKQEASKFDTRVTEKK